MEPTPLIGRRYSVPISSRGGAIAGLEFGDADRPVDIVWSHANGFNARTYSRILERLTGKRVLALDLRGHGLTALPTDLDGRDGWRQFADDLLAVLEAMDLRDVVLAGHSLGATTSLLAADLDPSRIRTLVLFEPVLLLPPAQAGCATGTRADPSRLEQGALKRRRLFASRAEAEDSYRGRGAFRTWPDAILSDYVADGFRDRQDGTVELACAPEWEASNFSVSRAIDADALLRRCPIPTLILRGSLESTCEVALSEGRDGLVAARTIPDASHFLPMERPELVVDALMRA